VQTVIDCRRHVLPGLIDAAHAPCTADPNHLGYDALGAFSIPRRKALTGARMRARPLEAVTTVRNVGAAVQDVALPRLPSTYRESRI